MSDTSSESHMKTIPSHLKNIVNLNTDNPPTKDVADEVFKVIMVNVTLFLSFLNIEVY
jgi:hypothetical protein